MTTIPYTCPRCNYNCPRRDTMRTHFKRNRGCPNINNVELTDEIKNIVLNDRVYHPPKIDVKKRKEVIEVEQNIVVTSNVGTSNNNSLDGTNILYLIKLREHVNNGENVFKFGRTNKTMRERLNGYPKGSEVICMFNCKHIGNSAMEKHLKDAYSDSEDFKIRTDLGLEFVEGEPLKVLYKFLDVIKFFDVM